MSGCPITIYDFRLNLVSGNRKPENNYFLTEPATSTPFNQLYGFIAV